MDSRVGKSVKDCIRHFTPAWFAVNMGTGAISNLFHNFPYADDSDTTKTLATVFFFLNLVLFVIFNVITISRFIFFPDIWSLMIHHPVQSLFLGTYPMGAATLISVAVLLFYSDDGVGGSAFLYLLWTFWWVDLAVSLLCAYHLVHIMITRQSHDLQRMSAVWLLPVVTLVIAGSCGGIFVVPLNAISPSHALLTLVVSCVSLSMGLLLTFMIFSIYFLRLVVHGYPASSSVVSSFIPMGPMSQGGYTMILIGQGFKAVLPLTYGSSEVLHNGITGDVIDIICSCAAFVMWSFATLWLVYAILGVQHEARKARFPFKIPFWGLIFPIGVYANLSIELYRIFDSPFFRIYGALFSVITLAMWTAVFLRTVWLVRMGVIFEAPCLEDVDMSLGLEKRARSRDGERVPAAQPGQS